MSKAHKTQSDHAHSLTHPQPMLCRIMSAMMPADQSRTQAEVLTSLTSGSMAASQARFWSACRRSLRC